MEGILQTDQNALKDFKKGKISPRELANINAKNVQIVKEIISQIGFPTIKRTSYKAYKAAVLVVLHSEDITFINQSVKHLQDAEPLTIERRDIAYLVDKARVIQNMSQLYGTQYVIDVNRKITFISIQKPDELEKRRAELGMESFDDYKKSVEQIVANY